MYSLAVKLMSGDPLFFDDFIGKEQHRKWFLAKYFTGKSLQFIHIFRIMDYKFRCDWQFGFFPIKWIYGY